jgi:polysaccharide transporter, PST family
LEHTILNRANVPGILAHLAIAATQAARMVLGLFILKVIATFLGAEQLGLLGNMMTLVSFMIIFAGGGIGNSVPKFVAQYQARKADLSAFLATVFVYGLIAVCAFGILAVPFQGEITIFLLGDIQSHWLVPSLPVFHFFAFLSVFSIGIVNGLRQARALFLICTPVYVALVPVTFWMVSRLGIDGAILSLLLMASATGLSGAVFVVWYFANRWHQFRPKWQYVAPIFRFSLMLVTASVLYSASEIFIRTQIISSVGLGVAGEWQGMIRLSGAYLNFFNIILLSRYMPMIAAQTDASTIVKTVRTYGLVVGGIFIATATMIYLLRDIVIVLALSPEFLAISDVLHFQLAGDGMRILASLIGLILIAKGAHWLYITAEAIQMSLWVGATSVVVTHWPSLLSVSAAYLAAYSVYFAIMAIGALVLWRRQRSADQA